MERESQALVNTWLRRIILVRWSCTISNDKCGRRTTWKWQWIGRTLWRADNFIAGYAMHWIPHSQDGQRVPASREFVGGTEGYCREPRTMAHRCG